MKNWFALTVSILYFALYLVPFAIVVWKDFTTDEDDEPETLVPSRTRLLVAAALVVSAPFLVERGMWHFQMVSLLATACLIAPTKYRRWFGVGSLVGPVLLRAIY